MKQIKTYIAVFIGILGSIIFPAVLHTNQNEFPVFKGPYLGQKPPGKTPEIFAPGIISPEEGYHSSPVFSPDGKKVFWATMTSGILYMKINKGRWTSPAQAPFQKGKFQHCDSPFFSLDGNRLYFIALIVKDHSEKELLCYVNRMKNTWSEPNIYDPLVNNGNMHWQFSFAENGDLYFTAERDDGFGRYDLYKSVSKNGKYLEPENLGALFNTEESDAMPFIAPDGSLLVFASAGRDDGYGESDLYVSFRKNDGSWTVPKNLGPKVNTANHEICPIISPDGKYLFFLKNHGVYWVDAKIIDELRPKE
jgi:Tol biopolymer transport system component